MGTTHAARAPAQLAPFAEGHARAVTALGLFQPLHVDEVVLQGNISVGRFLLQVRVERELEGPLDRADPILATVDEEDPRHDQSLAHHIIAAQPLAELDCPGDAVEGLGQPPGAPQAGGHRDLGHRQLRAGRQRLQHPQGLPGGPRAFLPTALLPQDSGEPAQVLANADCAG